MKCEICKQSFRNKRAYRVHFTKKHTDRDESEKILKLANEIGKKSKINTVLLACLQNCIYSPERCTQQEILNISRKFDSKINPDRSHTYFDQLQAKGLIEKIEEGSQICIKVNYKNFVKIILEEMFWIERIKSFQDEKKFKKAQKIYNPNFLLQHYNSFDENYKDMQEASSLILACSETIFSKDFCDYFGDSEPSYFSSDIDENKHFSEEYKDKIRNTYTPLGYGTYKIEKLLHITNIIRKKIPEGANPFKNNEILSYLNEMCDFLERKQLTKKQKLVLPVIILSFFPLSNLSSIHAAGFDKNFSMTDYERLAEKLIYPLIKDCKKIIRQKQEESEIKELLEQKDDYLYYFDEMNRLMKKAQEIILHTDNFRKMLSQNTDNSLRKAVKEKEKLLKILEPLLEKII